MVSPGACPRSGPSARTQATPTSFDSAWDETASAIADAWSSSKLMSQPTHEQLPLKQAYQNFRADPRSGELFVSATGGLLPMAQCGRNSL